MPRDLRYLMVTTDFPPGVGGVQRLLADLCKGLSSRGAVSVVALGAPPADGSRRPDRDVKYVRPLPWKPLTYLSLAAATAARAFDRDVMICGHVNAGPAVLAAHFLCRKPYIVYVHAMEVTYRKWRPLYRLLLKRARKVVVGSSFAKTLVAELIGVDSAEVVNPSVSPAMVGKSIPGRLKPLRPRRLVRKILLTVGRLDAAERYKGHDTVIAAMPEIKAHVPEAEYWIVGDGTDRPRLEALAAGCNVSGCVRFLGYAKDVVPFYRMCDIFVMVADVFRGKEIVKGEGFGLVFIEAALFGKPVIAARCGGATDAVLDGYTGFLVPPGAPDALADKAVFLLKNPRYAEAMGRRGKAWVLSRFNQRRQLDEFESVLLRSL